ncbi:MAG TPA: 16S rRNA (cytosine(1402)-N(4))-methyltransferase RsmH [Verrucomicrobiae bacterium]|nr:16S rRNA (cytosine(1402)-N(4))-methyltransferase RsmH [Verrucomicrobiae bacterium]
MQDPFANPNPASLPQSSPPGAPHRRRPRYPGRNPRRFADKYKEHDPARHGDTIAKVLASGKTPAGTHRPIMVAEVLEILSPAPAQIAVDCTLGYGGHAQELLPRLLPGGRLIGLDADPLQAPHTESRLRGLGFGPDVLTVIRGNFAGLPKFLAGVGIATVDLIVADLGVSSMQLDDPARGFSLKEDGPLDMRMNPGKGESAAHFLQRSSPAEIARVLSANADEPRAEALAAQLAGKFFPTTFALISAIRRANPEQPGEEHQLSVRRVFQALRIFVNDEFSALETLLRVVPDCFNPGGRFAVLTFHSGEDRRVKKAFSSGLARGQYSSISGEVTRPQPEEILANPRSKSARLRWAVR